MTKLFTIGTFYGNRLEDAQKVFDTLTDAGYILAFDPNTDLGCTILEPRVIDEVKEDAE